MNYLACEIRVTTTSGKTLDDLVLNARALGKCRFDLNGHMTHG